MTEVKDTSKMLGQEQLLVDETLLSTANGYIGVRGNFEEGYNRYTESIRGTYINGFYDIVDVLYGEKAYGFPETAQKIVNVIDVQGIELWLGKERFNLFDGEVLSLSRRLDIWTGVAIRHILWRSPMGHRIEIDIRRMASFEKTELLTIDYSVKSLDYSGPIRIVSTVKGDVENDTISGDPRVTSGHAHLLDVKKIHTNDDLVLMQAVTRRSGLTMSVAVAHNLHMTHEMNGPVVESVHSGKIRAGETIRLIKYAVFTDSVRHGHNGTIAEAYIREAVNNGIEQWYKAQKDYMTHFWKTSRLTIDGDEAVEEALNYSIYQLLASAGKDGYSSVAAKGLSGEGYEGHYFWDMEIYMLPFFTLTNPNLARELMIYRYTTLGASKARARELGHNKGAKVAWRTISGSECSGNLPVGTAQYHINADVAYSYLQYWRLTADDSFMEEYGAEVLLETARLWLETGNYDSNGEFVINAVTGPDEYTAIVNNNFYTNAMAKYHLEGCVEVLDHLRAFNRQAFSRFSRRVSLESKELDAMTHAAANMHLPHDDGLGIDLQDDSFLQKPAWDFTSTPEDKYPLLNHFHPLTLYRHKVLKQADTVLAHLLLDNRNQETMENSFRFYEGYTTHDSSLSPCVHAMMAARIGDVEKAYGYFMKTLRLDLDNLNHNTKDGLHIANAGGAYMTVVYGFGGLRVMEDKVVLRPCLPSAWNSYSFTFLLKGVKVKITVGERIKIRTNGPVTLRIYDREYRIKREKTVDLL